MRIQMEDVARRVEPEAAIQWWTDFREGHSDHDFLPGARRTLLPAPEGRWRMREEVRPMGVPLFHEESTVWREGDRVVFEGHNGFCDFTGSYTFTSAQAGTRIALDADIRLRPRLAWSERVASPIAQRILKQDLRGHVRQLERDLGRA